MSLRNILIAFAVIFIAIFLLSRMRDRKDEAPAEKAAAGAASDTSGGSCVPAARAASEALGSGLGRFVNPPVDLAAFETYKSGVETKIRAAEAQCSCLTEQCVSVREAMGQLRGILGSLDAAARSGAPPDPGVVQAIEAVDARINAAGP